MGEYAGRSLAWVRKMKGLPPKYPTAKLAMEASDVNVIDNPPEGAIVWLKGGMYGDVGLMDADDVLVMLNLKGDPIATTVWYEKKHGNYIGWSKTIGKEAEDGES